MYHSLGGSYLDYDAQLWDQTNAENVIKSKVLQNRVLRKITFKNLHDSTNEKCKNLKILRLSDSVCLRITVFFLNQIEQNEKIAKSFSKLKYCADNHNYSTR